MGKHNKDAEEVRRLLHYDPETGVFTWRVATSNRVKVGDRAGSINSHGRRFISFQGRRLPASRLATLYMTGDWPVGLVDHESRDPTDDRWENLRPATFSQNAGNTRAHRDNASGFKGVHLHGEGRWRAQIRVGKKRRHLGLFDSPEAAHAAYVSAAKEAFGEFGTGGVS